ncbi:MAG: putative Phosphoesterase, PA-phosphatase related [Blastococcus sp.]|nr:putative Phosphoesterase, PA-phosphatase related [Blastococcus sp.]
MTAVENTERVAAPPTASPVLSSRRRITSAAPAAGLPTARTVLRVLLWTGLLVAFVATCAVKGLPTDRVVLLGWVLTGLTVHAATQGWRRVVRLIADWVPLTALLLLYDVSRGLADGVGMAVHVKEPAAADLWLGGGVLPTVWLQQHLVADWWKALAALVYCSHFVVTPVLLCLLWLRDRKLWARYVRLVLALSAAGLATYVLYPAAPPWLAARDGVIEPVRRLSGAGWDVLGLPRAGAFLADSQGQVNQVAAVPSLHTAFAVLACLVFLPLARHTWQRVGLVAYAVLMPLVLVWAGEHYVVDTVLGAGYAAAVILVVAAARRAWQPAARGEDPPTLQDEGAASRLP